MRTRVGLGKLLPVRSAITRCSDATESGPSSSRRTCAVEPCRAEPGALGLRAERDDHLDPCAREPPRGEGEGRGGGRVEPVRVVDGEHDGSFGRECPEQRQERRPDQPPLGRPLARRPENRDLERVPLRRRQVLEAAGVELCQQVGQPGERERRLRLCGPRGEDTGAELAAPGERPLPRRPSCRSRARRRSRARPRLRTPRGTPRRRKARARARRAWTRPEGTPRTTRTPSDAD